MSGNADPARQQALAEYKTKLLEVRSWEGKLKDLRLGIKDLEKDFNVTEDNIKALQSVGQIIGEVLKQLDEERCKPSSRYSVSSSHTRSHRESLLRSAICRRLPFESR